MPVDAETTLLVTGTYASAADRLGIDLTMPAGMGRLWASTYGSAGGTAPDSAVGAPPAVPIGPGGIDSLIRLFNSTNTEIGFNDDHDGTLDSLLVAGVVFFAPPGYTQIPALPPGDYHLRQDVFGGSLNNGAFALSATSVFGFDSAGAYTIRGFSPTPGVVINTLYFGQKPTTASAQARLVFDSPSDALSVTSFINLYGNFDLTLPTGSISTPLLKDGPISGVAGGNGLVNLNGGSLATQTQHWGSADFQKTVINHTAGSNVATGDIHIAKGGVSEVTYNLSGSGSVSANTLWLGADLSNPIVATFNQSGGTADFNRVVISNIVSGRPPRTYRLTGGVAIIDALEIRDEGQFELAGGTLALPAIDVLFMSDPSRFKWFTGTVRLPTFTLDGSAAPHFGPTLTLTPGKALEVTGATTVNTVVTFDGGRLITQTLGGNGAYVLDAGELAITGAGGLAVGAAGPLGNVLAVKPDFYLNVSTGLVVESAALLNIRDQGRVRAATITNNAGGLIQLGGPTASLEGAGAINNAGVLAGSGLINHALANLAGGEVSAAIGQTLRFTNATAAHSNQGLMRLAGGELLFSGALTNNAAGNIEGRGVLRTGGLTNQGDVALSNGIADVHGDVVNAPGGRVIVSGNADVTFWDDVQNSGALFKVSDGSSTTFFGAYGGAGVSGAGDVYFESDVTPGASPALAQFEGDVTFGAISSLAIELGGVARGSQYDAIDVDGNLSLAGTLDVSLINGFVPTVGQSFDILGWGVLSGAFSTINLPSLPGLAWDDSQLYTTGVLSVESAFLEADFEEDGDVDGSDLTRWRAGFGAGTTHPQGDADGDADVDGTDFLVWQRSVGGVSVAIPEPRLSAMLVITAVMGAAWNSAVRKCADGAPRRLS